MKRRFMTMWGLILYPTRLHFIGIVLALLCCIPILFPDSCPKETEHVCITKQGLRCIDKILFESPKGWTVSSKILGDYSRFIKHLDSGKLLEANKTWLGKLFSKK